MRYHNLNHIGASYLICFRKLYNLAIYAFVLFQRILREIYMKALYKQSKLKMSIKALHQSTK